MQEYTPGGTLQELLHRADTRFGADFEPVTIGAQKLDILQIRDMPAYLEKLTARSTSAQKVELPFWAKIWQASVLLGHFLQTIPVQPGTTALEIGAGIGLCGLVTAARGMDTTITDIDEDALLFTKINILKNGLEKTARVAELDYSKPWTGPKYDYVIGSEVLYQEENYKSLVELFKNAVKPGGEVILARDFRRKSKNFFEMAPNHFHIMEKTIGFKESGDKADGEKFLCTITRMKLK